MAMMGSATAGGADRARTAAQQAVKSPLLEDVNLLGARGVLVNITASAGLKMREYHEVMNTIKEFTAEDAMVIVGTVIDDAMEDRLRVTMVATGLGGAATPKRAPPASSSSKPPVVRNGTDGTGMPADHINYEELDQPAVVRRGRVGPFRRQFGGGVRRGGHSGVPAQAGGLTAPGDGRAGRARRTPARRRAIMRP